MEVVRKHNFFLKLICLFILFVGICKCQVVHAQQTIINVPSSEVVPAGDLIIKDSNNVWPFETDRYFSLTPSVTFGSGFGTEISTGVGTSIDENYNTRVKANFSGKKVFYLGSLTRLTMGGTISPYLTESIHPDTFAYAHLSQKIKKTKTSITAGAYLGGRQSFANTGGVILGLDQVIIPSKLRLVVDWLSGDSSYGRMGLGLKYRPVRTVSITSAVIIPNKDTETIGFKISVSKFIALDKENPIKRRFRNVE